MRAGLSRLCGREPGPRLIVALLATLALVACAVGTTPDRKQGRPTLPGEDRLRSGGPSGVVRVAYPEEPGSWYPASGEEPASIDLAALWGLPLYRLDPYGQLRPVLAESSEVHPGSEGGPWEVDVRLRRGSWSDGLPVVAADVVATLEAGRPARPAELEVLLAATAIDERTVRLTFSRPYGRWSYLLAGGFSVLPAHVVTASGLSAYTRSVPVAGGPFRLETYEPGLRATFVAHPDGPLGSPALQRIEVYFTPSYETALGLLRDRQVDVALGHLALNPLERARRVDEVQAAAPLGGTWVLLSWRAGGRVASFPQRRSVIRDVVDASELVEGLLGEYGEVMTSTIPGVKGPWAGAGRTSGRIGRVDLELLMPAQQEVPNFTARALLLDLSRTGAEIHLIRIEPDELAVRAAREADGSLLVRRDLPRPSLVARAPPDAPAELRAALGTADAAASPDVTSIAAAFDRLHGHAAELPLYRVGVAHVWRSSLLGLRPSAWPGLAFWDATAWHWLDDEPPPQVPTLNSERR